MSESVLINRIDNLIATYTLGDDGAVKEAPARRLKSALKARKIHTTLKKDDQPRERNRARIQDVIDGKPPLNQGLLNRRGRGHQFNINFGQGAAIHISRVYLGYAP